MKELPAVRRTQPITKRPKKFQQPMSNCYNGYMVNNNNIKHEGKRNKIAYSGCTEKSYLESIPLLLQKSSVRVRSWQYITKKWWPGLVPVIPAFYRFSRFKNCAHIRQKEVLKMPNCAHTPPPPLSTGPTSINVCIMLRVHDKITQIHIP